MDYVTVGRSIYPGYRLQLYVDQQNDEPGIEPGGCFRLVFLHSGFAIVDINDNRLPITGPCAVCLDEKDSLRFHRTSALKYSVLYMHPSVLNIDFDFENIRTSKNSFPLTASQDLFLLNPFLERDDTVPKFIVMSNNASIRLTHLLNDLQRELDEQRDTSWPCRSRSILFEILVFTEKLWSNHGLPAETIIVDSTNGIDEVILYLHINYQSKITIDELTKRFHINRTTLSQRFADATGQSIMSYLIGLRIRLASLMLRDTTLPVHEVMEKVGFSDSSHFVRTFKKHIGLAPIEYRQQYCWMA